MSIHRTDCINIINLSDVERSRLITAEWEENDQDEGGQYLAELKIFADDRRGLLLDVSKVFTEEKIDVKSMNTRTSKKVQRQWRWDLSYTEEKIESCDRKAQTD